jgi:hypothetical protein
MLKTMPSATAAFSSDAPAELAEFDSPYRSLSKTALLCFVLGLFSLGALLAPEFLVLPIVGLLLGIFAWLGFRRHPEELIGRPFAAVGGLLSAALLVGGIGWHTYCYNTEVPEGYERILFKFLKPEKGSGQPFSQLAESLDGKRVFIKGYVRPSERKNDLKDFIFVGDFGQCCFGGSPKIDEVIAVSFVDDKRVDYSLRRRHIAGVFRLNRNTKRTSEKEVPRVLYSIEADYLK